MYKQFKILFYCLTLADDVIAHVIHQVLLRDVCVRMLLSPFPMSDLCKSVRCYMFDFYVKIKTLWRYDEFGVFNTCNDLKE